MRLLQRNLNGAILVEGAATLEIIESYPNDKYLPSYLLRGEHEQYVFHVQAAADVDGDNVRIVTIYKPEPEEWDAGFRIRRSQP